jgi:hypothetical protein
VAPEQDSPDAGAAPPLTLRYAVIAAGREWRVLSGRAQIGRFATRAEALVVAVGLTKQALQSGHQAELLAQQEGGDFSLQPMFRAEF